jgi:hypothetical protein
LAPTSTMRSSCAESHEKERVLVNIGGATWAAGGSR